MGLSSQSPDLSDMGSDSPNARSSVPVGAPKTAPDVSPVSAALRQAEEIPDTARAMAHAAAKAIAASRNTTGRKSRVVLKEPRPIVTEIGSWFLAATRLQSKAVTVAAIASPIATALAP